MNDSLNPVSSAMPIVVCADDFGMNDAANRAIIRLIEAGRLNATSCLVDGPKFVEGMAVLRDTRAQTGLHLNFTDNLGQRGVRMGLRALIAAAYSGRLDRRAVHDQVVRQLDRFESVTGRAPHYVDGHLHIHQLPVIRDALLQEMARRYRSGQRPWLRSTRVRTAQLPLPLRFKARVIQALGAGPFRREAQRLGFDTNTRFLGVYGFSGGAVGYQACMQAWLAAAETGDLIMCHPELGDQGDGHTDVQRNAEFQVLSSEWFAECLSHFRLVVQ